MKLICYELNEVPWFVIDEYVREHPQSALAEIVNQGCQMTTVTHDKGELTPFFTWPTLHRGVYNDVHNIHFMNQSITTPHLPVWEILAKNKVSVGVFGSLHSWPIPSDQAYSFYVPHTFAQDAQALPKNLEVFQAFNLEQTRRDVGMEQTRADKVTVKKELKLVRHAKTVFKLIQSGLSILTVMRLAWYIVLEKWNINYRSIRPIMQAPVAFDFYWKLVKKDQPQFSTFFTNHVAGIMHRYWKYAYPNDFGYTLTSKYDRFLAENINRAMDITEEQLKKLRLLCDQKNFTLMIVSSMGQEAIHREERAGELRITDQALFIEKMGFSGCIKPALSMQPYFAFLADSTETLKAFELQINKLTDEDGKQLFNQTKAGDTINLKLKGYSKNVVLSGSILYDHQSCPLNDFGINVIHRDLGTGYHQPKGIAIFYGHNVKQSSERQEIESIQVLPTILDCFGMQKESYMAPSFYNDVFLNSAN